MTTNNNNTNANNLFDTLASFTDEEIAAVRKFLTVILSPFAKVGPTGEKELNRQAMLYLLEKAAPYTSLSCRLLPDVYLSGASAALDYTFHMLRGVKVMKTANEVSDKLIEEIEKAVEEALKQIDSIFDDDQPQSARE